MKSFGKKNFMLRSKSAFLAIFQKGPGLPCPDSSALKNLSQDFKKSFCLGFYEFLVMLEGKIRETLYNAQSGKIKVCQMFESTTLLQGKVAVHCYFPL